VTATDEAGNSATDGPVSFTVDLTAPTVAITSPADGTLTSAPATLSFRGISSGADTVDVSVSGAETGAVDGTVVLTDDGSWTFTPMSALADDRYTIEALATDEAGNTADAAPVSFTVDTTPPGPVTIDEPDEGKTVGPTPTISGECEPGATVWVSINGAEPVAVECSEDGTWQHTPAQPLPNGPATVVAVQEDEAGNVSEPVTREFVVARCGAAGRHATPAGPRHRRLSDAGSGPGERSPGPLPLPPVPRAQAGDNTVPHRPVTDRQQS